MMHLLRTMGLLGVLLLVSGADAKSPTVSAAARSAAMSGAIVSGMTGMRTVGTAQRAASGLATDLQNLCASVQWRTHECLQMKRFQLESLEGIAEQRYAQSDTLEAWEAAKTWCRTEAVLGDECIELEEEYDDHYEELVLGTYVKEPTDRDKSIAALKECKSGTLYTSPHGGIRMRIIDVRECERRLKEFEALAQP